MSDPTTTPPDALPTDAAREAAPRTEAHRREVKTVVETGEAWLSDAPSADGQYVHYTFAERLEKEAAALRREVEGLKAERDAARRSLTLGQLANGGLRVQLAEATKERDALRTTGDALREYCITHPQNIIEIPDDIWNPFQAAIDAAGGTEG